ncbi:MAG: efflux RND transporter permease subunit [Armatimonadetes bacterium]|nr:efflux RND transporter permease subunit [Armatimonadota bacterium]
MTLWKFCIERPVFTTVLICALLAFGALGYSRMGVDLYPEIEPPVVNIRTVLPGANPEVMDQDVTEILEDEVGALAGIDTITSQSLESVSTVTVQFDLNRNIDVAAQEVRDRVAIARRRLPNDIEPPVVEKVDPAASPIMWLAVVGDGPYLELSEIADKYVKERIQGLDGVGGVQMGGFQERTVRVWVKPDRLDQYQLGPIDVMNGLRNWQLELPGGRVENRLSESSIQVEGEFRSIERMGDLVLAYQDGGTVRLRDVAELEDGLQDQRGLARFLGQPTIGLGIRKQSGGNTVAVVREVMEALPEIREGLPDWVDVRVAFDSARFIEASIEGVQFDVLFGALFTCLVIGLFLRNIPATIVSVIAIPASLVGAFFLLYLRGFTINQMSMLGMSLAVGLVIDDAIVVIESIFRHLHQGKDPVRAAVEGTQEVAFAVIAATFSIIAIFVPVGFMGGVVGQFFGQFGLTVALTIFISLIVSLTLTPMMSSRLLREHKEGPLARALGKPVDWMETAYRGILAGALSTVGRRLAVVGAAAVLFFGGLALASRLGSEFVPDTDDSRFLIFFETPLGSSLQVTDDRVKEAERLIMSHPEVIGAFMAIGILSNDPNKGLFFITLKKPHDRTVSQKQLMGMLRKDMNDIPGFIAFPATSDPLRAGVGQRNSDIQYVVAGPDLAVLDELAVMLERELKADPTFVDVDTNLELTRPQVKVTLKRDAAVDLGLNTRDISTAIQAIMGGVDVATFKEGGDRYDIRVKAIAGDRTQAGDILRIPVRNVRGEKIYLSSVVEIEETLGPNAINRYNRQRAVTVSSNVVDGVPVGNATERFVEIAKKVLEPYNDYKLEAAGSSKMMQESMAYLMFALIMAVLVVYGILAAQFESFSHPFTIMLTLPLATIGVFLALFMTRMTLNIFSFIGIIMLAGIVTRNAILLVDLVNQLRGRGVPVHEAVLQAGPIRLRPILMTSISAMVGILPVALGWSEGGEARAPMGVAVIGGLLTSTALTLVVIPAVYLLFEDARRLRDRVRRS